MNPIIHLTTPFIHGFNVQFSLNDLAYFRLRSDLDSNSCSKMRLAKHDQAILAIDQHHPNILQILLWGALPIWWQEHPKFNGLPIYFIRTNQLHLPIYQNLNFLLIPIKSIMFKEASQFKNVFPKEDKYHWLIGIGYNDREAYQLAFLQKENQMLATIEEHKVQRFYRSKRSGELFIHFIRNELSLFVSPQTIDKLAPVDNYYQD